MADTAITVAANATLNNLFGGGVWGPYWLSTSVGGVVYIGVSAISAQKTTDGGATWDVLVLAEASTGTTAYACWFDRQTPGNTGTKIHCVWFDSVVGDFTYAAYDINADTWSSPVDINASATGAAPYIYLAGTRAGGFVAGLLDGAVGVFNYKSADGVTWNAIADPFESNAQDAVLGVSVNTGDTADAGIVFWDHSANATSVKIYDASGDTWTETAIGSATETTTNYSFSVATRLSDGATIFAVWNATDIAGADLLCYALTLDSVAAPTVTPLTNVLTDSAESGVSGVFVDQTNDDLYVVYARGSAFAATVKIFYKKSTDDGSTWGVESAMSEDAEDDFRAIHGGAMGATQGGRFQPSWFDDDDQDIFVNLTNDIEIAAAAAGGHPTWKRHGGVTFSALRAPAQAGMRVF